MEARLSGLDGYEIGPQIAYAGKDGCESAICTRDGSGRCRGYHCPFCDEPTGMYGHYTTGAAINGRWLLFRDHGWEPPADEFFRCQPGYEEAVIELRTRLAARRSTTKSPPAEAEGGRES